MNALLTKENANKLLETNMCWVLVYRDNLVSSYYIDDRFTMNCAEIKIKKSILKDFYKEKVAPNLSCIDKPSFSEWYENEYTCDDTDGLIEFIHEQNEVIYDYNFDTWTGISLQLIREKLNAPHLSDEEIVENYELAAECCNNNGSLLDFDCMVAIQKALDERICIEYSDYILIAESNVFGDELINVGPDDAYNIKQILGIES